MGSVVFTMQERVGGHPWINLSRTMGRGLSVSASSQVAIGNTEQTATVMLTTQE